MPKLSIKTDPTDFDAYPEVSPDEFDQFPEAIAGGGEVPMSEPTPSLPATNYPFIRGAAQGLTFDLADELAGGGEALYDIAAGRGSLAELPELYKRHRGESRAAYKAAQAESPEQYLAGELTGAIGGALSPLNAPFAAIKASRPLYQAMKTGAAAGALQGFGASEGGPREAVIDTATGAAIGAPFGAAIHGMGKGIGAVGRGAAWLGKKAGALVGVPESATERYLNRPNEMRKAIKEGFELQKELEQEVKDAYAEYVAKPTKAAMKRFDDAREAYNQARDIAAEVHGRTKTALTEEATRARDAAKEAQIAATERLKGVRPPEALAPDIERAMEAERKAIGGKSGESFQQLEKEGIVFSPQNVIDLIDQRMEDLRFMGEGVKTGPAGQAYSQLERLKKEFEGLKQIADDGTEFWPDIPATELKRMVQFVDLAAKPAYDSPDAKFVAEAFKKVREGLDWEFLKDPEIGSQKYREIMAEISPRMDLLEAMRAVFRDEATARQNLRLMAYPDSETGRKARLALKAWDDRHGTNYLSQIDEYIRTQGILQSPTLKAAYLSELPESQAALKASEAKKAYKRSELPETKEAVRAREEMLKAKGEYRTQKEKAEAFSKVKPGSARSAIAQIGFGKLSAEQLTQLQALQEIVGKDFIARAMDIGAAKQFTQPKPQGSRNVNAMMSFLGPKPGALTGMTIDRKGGLVWKSILDGVINVGRYKKAFQKAYQEKGGSGLMVYLRAAMAADPGLRESLANQIIEAVSGGANE